MPIIGKPGVVVITDDGGTWTAGDVVVAVAGQNFTQSFDTDKDTSMTALAVQMATGVGVDTVVYDSGAHTITITPLIGASVSVEYDFSTLTGTMTFNHSTTTDLPVWATDVAAVISEPITAKKEGGFDVSEKPPAHWFNYLLNLYWLFFRWIDYVIGETAEGSFEINIYNDTVKIPIAWYKRGRDVIINFTQTSGINIGGTGNFYLGSTRALPPIIRPVSNQPVFGIIVRDDAGSPVDFNCMLMIKTNGRIDVYRGFELSWATSKPSVVLNSAVKYIINE
jgi:hypothetical protein